MGAIGLRGGLGACVKVTFFFSFLHLAYTSRPQWTDFRDLYVKVVAPNSGFSRSGNVRQFNADVEIYIRPIAVAMATKIWEF